MAHQKGTLKRLPNLSPRVLFSHFIKKAASVDLDHQLVLHSVPGSYSSKLVVPIRCACDTLAFFSFLSFSCKLLIIPSSFPPSPSLPGIMMNDSSKNSAILKFPRATEAHCGLSTHYYFPDLPCHIRLFTHHQSVWKIGLLT